MDRYIDNKTDRRIDGQAMKETEREKKYTMVLHGFPFYRHACTRRDVVPCIVHNFERGKSVAIGEGRGGARKHNTPTPRRDVRDTDMGASFFHVNR